MAIGLVTSIIRNHASRNSISRFKYLNLYYRCYCSKSNQFEALLPPVCKTSKVLGLPSFDFFSYTRSLGSCLGFQVRNCSSLRENEDGVGGALELCNDGVERCTLDEVVGDSARSDSEKSLDEEGSVFGWIGDRVDVLDENSVCKDVRSVVVDNVNSGGDGRLAKNVNYGHVGSLDPVELYKEIRDSRNRLKLGEDDWESLHEIFRYFAKSGWAADQALAIYIGKSFFPTACTKFRNYLFKRLPEDIIMYLLSLGPSEDAVKFLFPIFVEFCLEKCTDEIKRFQSMIESADLTKPHTWFPFARAMKRKIIYHCGPTNSGKTYNALQRFMEAKNGIYCSPLRLLAMEVFDKVNALGVYCSLHTGQEKKNVPFANHVACTVEMVKTGELYDVAVIDEIQMMSDPYRGNAWTRALLGLMADEIHLCGDPSVLNIVRKICSDMGDELQECHYERFKPLVVEEKTLLGDLRNVRSGDCVVAFSRREIFEVKLAVEKHTNHRCCVIYGALPPETRRQQAKLFNDQDSEYDVLVASDAVGMGLNLNIRRVVFYSLSKYNGDQIVPVPASQVKQIAGRAGRRGSIYPDGLTTTLKREDLDYLIECLKQPFDEVTKVGLFPFFEQVELFAGQFSDVTFSKLLEKFGENCRLDGSYFLCRHDHVKKVANMLEKVQSLSLEDRFNFCFAPVNVRDPKAMHHLLKFASVYSQNLPVNIAMGMPKGSARNDAELLDLETRHQVVSMYLWLSNHFEEETFPYVKKAEAMATSIVELLGESLINTNWKPDPPMQSGKANHKQKPEEEETGYDRPRAVAKLFDRQAKKGNHKEKPEEEVNVCNRRKEVAKLFDKKRHDKLSVEEQEHKLWELF